MEKCLLSCFSNKRYQGEIYLGTVLVVVHVQRFIFTLIYTPGSEKSVKEDFGKGISGAGFGAHKSTTV